MGQIHFVIWERYILQFKTNIFGNLRQIHIGRWLPQSVDPVQTVNFAWQRVDPRAVSSFIHLIRMMRWPKKSYMHKGEAARRAAKTLVGLRCYNHRVQESGKLLGACNVSLLSLIVENVLFFCPSFDALKCCSSLWLW